MRTVDLNNATKGFDDSCILNIGILTIFKRFALFDKYIENLKSTNFSFQLLCISCHIIQYGYKVWQQKVSSKSFSSQIDKIIGFFSNNLSSAAELL